MWLTDSKQVLVQIAKNGQVEKKTFAFEEDIPWIQQPTLGFKNFILSGKSEMSFYGVLPKNPFFLGAKPPLFMKATAKKLGEEKVPGQGKLMKVKVVSNWGLPYNLKKGELWFEPATGILRKFIIPDKRGEFVQNYPLPAPAHQ